MENVCYTTPVIDIIEQAAREAGEILLRYYKKEFTYRKKTSHHDIVTDADPEAQDAIIKNLTTSMKKKGFSEKDFGFIAEEELVNSKSTYTFVIDPLDGTTNFAAGIPLFCVSIALFKNDVLIAGLLYLPVQDTVYAAELKKGAYKLQDSKKTKLMISKNPLNEVILATTFKSTGALEFSQHIRDHVREVRVLGSAAVDLGWCAEGILGIVARQGTKSWDIAAGHLILSEAGGILVDYKGKELTYDLTETDKKYPHIATHPDLLPEILKFV